MASADVDTLWGFRLPRCKTKRVCGVVAGKDVRYAAAQRLYITPKNSSSKRMELRLSRGEC